MRRRPVTSGTVSATDLEKGELRRAVRARLSALTPEELVQSDSALFARLLALPQVEEADTIFAFWGIPGKEPDTSRLIGELVRRGKTVGLPRMLPDRRMEVSFGISEPGEDCPLLAREEIGLALAPAVCYDRRGFRLGFGGGYYDRWLEGFSGVTVGLCREAVLQDRVPTQAHDARVDILLTEGESLSL